MTAHSLTPATELVAKARTGFPGESEAYRAARQSLLAEEIEFRRHMTRLTEQRRALPEGPVIAKDYRFKDDAADDADVSRRSRKRRLASALVGRRSSP